MAVVDLDAPPHWWPQQAAEHLSADAARHFAGTDGALPAYVSPFSLLLLLWYGTPALCSSHQALAHLASLAL